MSSKFTMEEVARAVVETGDLPPGLDVAGMLRRAAGMSDAALAEAVQDLRPVAEGIRAGLLRQGAENWITDTGAETGLRHEGQPQLGALSNAPISKDEVLSILKYTDGEPDAFAVLAGNGAMLHAANNLARFPREHGVTDLVRAQALADLASSGAIRVAHGKALFGAAAFAASRRSAAVEQLIQAVGEGMDAPDIGVGLAKDSYVEADISLPAGPVRRDANDILRVSLPTHGVETTTEALFEARVRQMAETFRSWHRNGPDATELVSGMQALVSVLDDVAQRDSIDVTQPVVPEIVERGPGVGGRSGRVSRIRRRITGTASAETGATRVEGVASPTQSLTTGTPKPQIKGPDGPGSLGLH
jgi:hypothetical protein